MRNFIDIDYTACWKLFDELDDEFQTIRETPLDDLLLEEVEMQCDRIERLRDDLGAARGELLTAMAAVPYMKRLDDEYDVANVLYNDAFDLAIDYAAAYGKVGAWHE